MRCWKPEVRSPVTQMWFWDVFVLSAIFHDAFLLKEVEFIGLYANCYLLVWCDEHVFPGTLLFQADVCWGKIMCVEADAQKCSAHKNVQT